MISSAAGPDIMIAACLLICLACLACACCCDIRTSSIPDFIWWIMAADSLFIPVMITTGQLSIKASSESFILPAAIDCILVIIIQEKIMSRYYGRADSHAFSCCEMFFFFTGYAMTGHILHMSVSLALLSAVQVLRGNIGTGLRLKQPVPFVPYISVSFVISALLLKFIS